MCIHGHSTIESWLAKSEPRETLLEHTTRCVETALALLRALPPVDSKIAEQLLLAAASHDLGKAADGFQDVLQGRAANWGGKRHEVLSAALCAQLPGMSDAAVLSVLCHHKTLPSNALDYEKGTLFREQLPPPLSKSRAWKLLADELNMALPYFAAFWNNLRMAIPDADLPDWPPGFIDIHRSDLLMSFDKRWVSRDDQFEMPTAKRLIAAKLRGLLRTADHLASAHEMPLPPVNVADMYLGDMRLRGFQRAAGERDGDILLQAPTGSGKTEACLLWLARNQQQNGRIFYALPFTASINAMHKRLDRFFPGSVGVLHGRAAHYLNKRYSQDAADGDDEAKIIAQNRAVAEKGLAREMYYPIRVCTPHQLIRHFLRGPGWEQMLSEFESACFVFDEIHAYDPKMVGLILGGIRLVRQMGAAVAFVSATLPTFLKKLIQERLGITNIIVPSVSDSGDAEIMRRTRHRVRLRDESLLDVIGEIGCQLRKGSVLVVANHVRSAQEFYRRVIEEFCLEEDEAVLLHGSFNGRDRNQIEDKIMSGKPRLLVATQAVEVSLDISYDCGYFEAAPIDNLIQRMGRVNRSGNAPEPAPINIMARQMSRHNLYDKVRTAATLQALESASSVLSEAALVDLADRVYSGGYNADELRLFEDGFDHPDYVEFEKRFLAGAHQNWVEAIIDKSDQTVDVLPTCLVEEYEDLISRGLWLEAAGLLVPLKAARLARYGSLLFTQRDPWQIRLSYDGETGLAQDGIQDIESQLI